MIPILEAITFERGAVVIGGLWALLLMWKQVQDAKADFKERERRETERRERHMQSIRQSQEQHNLTMSYWDAKINHITNPFKVNIDNYEQQKKQ